MDPKALALPQSIIDLIPPRPANYDYNSDYSIEKLALLLILWQQLNPLLISLSFLFNTKRLNRLVEYQAENNGLGIDDMIEVLTSKFGIKKSRRFGRINTKTK
jgi:hypothetical protein